MSQTQTSLSITNRIGALYYDDKSILEIHLGHLLEKCIQGVLTDDQKNSMVTLLKRYFKILELKNDYDYFQRECAKFLPHTNLQETLSMVSDRWLYKICSSNQPQTENELVQKFKQLMNERGICIKDPLTNNHTIHRASRLRRLMAFLLDAALAKATSHFILSTIPFVFHHNTYIADFFSLILIQVYPLLRWNATLGKKVLRIKIISSDDFSPLTWWQILAREFIGKMLSALLLGTGYMLILLPGKKTLHDHLFGTLVVYDTKN